MRDESRNNLVARVWVKQTGGPVLIGERFREVDGRPRMIWHVDPESIVAVLWIEFIDGEDDEVSGT